MTSGYQNSLVFHYLDTFPKPPGVPDWPDLIPEPTLEELEQRIQAGCVVRRHARGVREGGAGLRRHRRRPARCSACCRPRCRSRSRSRRSRRSVASVIPEFDKDPVHSTTAPARGVRRRRAGRGSSRSAEGPRRRARLDGMAARATGGSRSSPAPAGASAPPSRCASPRRARRSRSPPARSTRHRPLPGTLRETVAADRGASAAARSRSPPTSPTPTTGRASCPRSRPRSARSTSSSTTPPPPSTCRRRRCR